MRFLPVKFPGPVFAVLGVLGAACSSPSLPPAGHGGSGGHSIASTVSTAVASSGGAGSGGAASVTSSADPCLFYGFQGADYTVLVSDDLVSLQLTPDAFKAMGDDSFPADGPWPKVVGTLFRDDFHWQLYVMNQFDTSAGAGADGSNHRTHGAASGIGLNVDDKAYAQWPNLLAVVYLGRDYDIAGGNMLHELMHTWANHVIPEGNGHWPWPSDINGKLGGGIEAGGLRHVDGNTYVGKISDPSDPYADLELYLMGVLPPSQVAPIHWLVNPTFVSSDFQTLETTFTADSMMTRDIDSIIAANGPRVPDSATALHDFRGLPVVVSPGPLTAADWLYFRTQAALLTARQAPITAGHDGSLFSPPRGRDTFMVRPQNFRQATKGVASLRLDGLLGSLVHREAATCVHTPPPAGHACKTLLARAVECGIPTTPCDADVAIPPEFSDCIAACASDATCDVLGKATEGVSSVDNGFLWCAETCQCVVDRGCYK